MKNIIFTFLLILCMSPSLANKCFEDLKKEGLDFYEQGVFEKARDKFKAAEGCLGNNERQRQEAYRLYIKADSAYDRALQEATLRAEENARIAERNALIAERNALISNASLLALQSSSAIESGQFDSALHMVSSAFFSLQEKDTMISSVAKAFGDAVYAKTQLVFPQLNSSTQIRQIYWFPDSKSLLGIGGGYSAIFQATENAQTPEAFKHHSLILDADVSDDGLHYLLTHKDGKISLGNISDTRPTQSEVHEGAVVSGAFISNSSSFVTTSRDLGIKFWNDNGQMVREFKGNNAPVIDFRSSANASLLITRSANGKAKLWNNEGQLLADIGYDAFIYDVTFSLDERHILSTHINGTVKKWDLEGNLVQVIDAHSNAVLKIKMLNDGTFFTSGIDRNIHHWTAQGEHIRSYAFEGIVKDMDVTTDNNSFIVGMQNGVVELHQIEGPFSMKILENSSAVKKLSFSPDDTSMMILWEDGSAVLCAHPEKIAEQIKQGR